MTSSTNTLHPLLPELRDLASRDVVIDHHVDNTSGLPYVVRLSTEAAGTVRHATDLYHHESGYSSGHMSLGDQSNVSLRARQIYAAVVVYLIEELPEAMDRGEYNSPHQIRTDCVCLIDPAGEPADWGYVTFTNYRNRPLISRSN